MHVAVAVLVHEQRRQTGKPEEAEQSPRKLITVLFRLNNSRSSWLCHDGSGRKGCHQGCREKARASGHVHLSVLADIASKARTPNRVNCSASVVMASCRSVRAWRSRWAQHPISAFIWSPGKDPFSKRSTFRSYCLRGHLRTGGTLYPHQSLKGDRIRRIQGAGANVGGQRQPGDEAVRIG